MIESKLETKLRQAKAEERTGLIPFLPAGFPDRQRFFDELKELDRSGADIIEIGIPFSDPVADGPVVEEVSQECLARGASLGWLFTELPKHRAEISAEIVLMGYVNPFMQHGWSRLARQAAALDLSGLIIPDLPLEESLELEGLFAEHRLDLIRLVGLNTPPHRMRLAAERAGGFVYFVSVLGTTGSGGEFPAGLGRQLRLAGEIFRQPLALGFGLEAPDRIDSIRDEIDAVVFGSALIKHIQMGGSSSGFMNRWGAQPVR
ncbi:MAG: tryptophan synthase subunit alpha [Desulfohalobiaceae bacterium]|nr:tryptophan synthase subunit alpha [Desulfohalobiaceae bacterium]